MAYIRAGAYNSAEKAFQNKLHSCKQALRDALAVGREKEGQLALRLWNLNICIEKWM